MQKILFTSLSPGNLGTARILWVLGMDESAFPRSDGKSSLCEMSRLKNSDYVPSKTDEDRAQFLELFIKAQDYLIFSYQRIHAEDAKHQGPSLLIEELNQYLNKRGLNEGIISYEHPFFPFDRSYFTADAAIKKWEPADYKAAQAHYGKHAQNTPFLVSTPFAPQNQRELAIDIRQLKKLARNPLQFYFNETLKIYLKEEEDEEETEFLMSNLRRSILRKKALHASLPRLMERMKAEGKMPRGLFKDVAVQDLEEEMSDLLSTLQSFAIRPDEIKAVRPTLPIPLSDSRVAHITGLLEDVSPRGLLFHGENDLNTLIKAWPLYLIYCCLFPESRTLLLTKENAALDIPISDPQAALASYIEYFLLARQQPSPLMPDFAKALLQEGTMGKELNYEDAYWNYVQRRGGILDNALWNDPLKKAFGPLLAMEDNAV
jgi:exodeoxyribonuclease V gamma subunit